MYFQNKIYKLNPNNPWQTLDAETIILSPQEKKAHELNSTGTLILQYLQEHNQASCEDLAKHLQKQFQVDFQKAQKDSEDFIQKLIQQNILVPENELI